VLVAVVLAFGCKKKKPTDTGGDSNPNAPNVTIGGGGGGNVPGAGDAPAGWSEARDTVGGYRVFLPGKTSKVDHTHTKTPELQPTTFYGSFADPNAVIQPKSHSFLAAPTGLKPGNSPDELLAAFKSRHRSIETFYLPPETTPITLGGKPALKIVLKPIPRKVPKPPFDDPEILKTWQEQVDQASKDAGRREVYFVTATPTRFIFIEVKAPSEPDPAFLKTITDSFAFL
jgi:hypothetical protein